MKALLDRGLEALTAPTESGLGGAVLAGAAALASLAVLGVVVPKKGIWVGVPVLRPQLLKGMPDPNQGPIDPTGERPPWQRLYTPVSAGEALDDKVVDAFRAWAKEHGAPAPSSSLDAWQPEERLVLADWLLEQGYEDDGLWLQLEAQGLPHVVASPVVDTWETPAQANGSPPPGVNVSFTRDQLAFLRDIGKECFARSESDHGPALQDLYLGSNEQDLYAALDALTYARDSLTWDPPTETRYGDMDLLDAEMLIREAIDQWGAPRQEIWFHGLEHAPPLELKAAHFNYGVHLAGQRVRGRWWPHRWPGAEWHVVQHGDRRWSAHVTPPQDPDDRTNYCQFMAKEDDE